MSDDGMAAGVVLKEGLEEKLAGGGVGIVPAHVNLAPDHFALGFEILLRETGKEGQLEEDMDKGVTGSAGTIDVVDGPIQGGVGIPLPSRGVDAGGQFRSRKGIRAFEHHVFEEVRESAAGEAPFVLAAGCDPALGGDNRCALVHLHDDSKPVGDGVQRGVGGGEFHWLSEERHRYWGEC